MKNKTLNVCFVSEDFYPNFIGGQGIYGYHLISGLIKKNVTVTVLAENRSGRKEFWKKFKNLNIVLTPFCFGNQLLLALFEFIYFKLNLFGKHFDILHANQLSGLLFVLFKPKNVKKIVISVHNTNYDMYQVEDSKLKRLLYLPLIFLERIVYRRADALLFNSPQEEKDLVKYYSIKNKPTKSVYLASPKVSFSAKEKEDARKFIRKKLTLQQDTKIVLYLGRLVKRKRVETLIKAMWVLDSKIPFLRQSPGPHLLGEAVEKNGIKNITALIIGNGRERRKLEKLAPANVRFLGFIENTRPYLLASDVFVLTSVAEGGIALSTLEAASYGLPLIVSPSVAGCPIIKNAENGYIVDPDDSNKLAKKIQLTVENYQSMSKESLMKTKLFSWDRSIKETISFYHAILSTA